MLNTIALTRISSKAYVPAIRGVARNETKNNFRSIENCLRKY
jgi:hypothetical protein